MGLKVLLINALAYTFVAFFYYIKKKRINTGFYIISFYAVCSWAAVAYYRHPLFVYFRGISSYEIEPFVYLFASIFIFIYPILRYDSSEITRIQLVNQSFMIKLIKLLFLIQCILYFTLLPQFLNAVLSSDLGAYRDETYDNSEVVVYPFYILNILSRLYMGMRNVVIIIASYCLLFLGTHRKLVKAFFISSIIYPIFFFTIFMSRAVMILEFCFILFIFIMLLSFIAYKYKRKIIIILISVAIPIVAIFSVISRSRFGDMATYMLYRYAGESFNNYNTEFYNKLKGNTWGDAYFTFFKKICGEEIPFKTTIDKWAYLDNITGVDTHIFYTFIGGLNIEFGFIFTIIIGLILSYIITKLLRSYETLTLSKFIIIGMLAYVVLNGAFYFVLQGDWGNLELLFTIFFYFIFRKYNTKQYIYKK